MTYPEDLYRKIASLAKRHGWRLVVLFGSSAKGRGRDADIAVLPSGFPKATDLLVWQEELEPLFAPRPVDLQLISERTSNLMRYEILCKGHCLYEDRPGLFDREYDKAFFLYADSAPLREELHRYLREISA
jgi:predicted nucleotidyltransferase